MPATPAMLEMTAVVRKFLFITTLLMIHRAFANPNQRLSRFWPALGHQVRQQRSYAMPKKMTVQSLARNGRSQLFRKEKPLIGHVNPLLLQHIHPRSLGGAAHRNRELHLQTHDAAVAVTLLVHEVDGRPRHRTTIHLPGVLVLGFGLAEARGKVFVGVLRLVCDQQLPALEDTLIEGLGHFLRRRFRPRRRGGATGQQGAHEQARSKGAEARETNHGLFSGKGLMSCGFGSSSRRVSAPRTLRSGRSPSNRR